MQLRYAEEFIRSAVPEGMGNRLRFRRQIPLSEQEIAAVDDGVAAIEEAIEKLQRSYSSRLLTCYACRSDAGRKGMEISTAYFVHFPSLG
jgi:hypothetical protein